MHDPEFVAPESKVFPGDPMLPVPRMARTGLVFGILSYFVLPVLGAIIAIVLGHFAQSEITESRGRLGGRPVARAAQVLGYLNLLLVALILGTVVTLLFVRDAQFVRGGQATVSSVAPLAPVVIHAGVFGEHGLRLAHELSPDESAYLMEHLELNPGEEIVCAVPDEPRGAKGNGQVLVLTNRSVATVHDGDVTVFPLEEMEVEADTAGQVVLRCKNGKQMRISIPGGDGTTFQRALERARQELAVHGHDAGQRLKQIQGERGAEAEPHEDREED